MATLAPALQVSNASNFIGGGAFFPIKSATDINQGCLVRLDSNGEVVEASKTQAAVVVAAGVAIFTDEHGTATLRTGVAGLTVKCAIARKCRIKGLDTTVVPAVAAGLRLFLGALPTATVSNYTATRSTTANDQLQLVGECISATEIDVDVQGSFFGDPATAADTNTLVLQQ